MKRILKIAAVVALVSTAVWAANIPLNIPNPALDELRVVCRSYEAINEWQELSDEDCVYELALVGAAVLADQIEQVNVAASARAAGQAAARKVKGAMPSRAQPKEAP